MEKNIYQKLIMLTLAGFSIYFYSQSVKLGRQVTKLEEACGEKCKTALIEFPITGLSEIADKFELDKAKLKQCLDEAKFTSKVNSNYDDARKLNISGTPANYLFNKNTGLGVFAPGSYPYEILVTSIKKLRDSNAKEGDIAFESDDKKVKLVVEKFPNLPVVGDDDHKMGNPDADIVLIEYSDLECPYCAKFHQTGSMLTKVDNVLWIYRHFPLRQAHPEAQKMAEAAECAADQKGPEMFWKMAEEFYANQKE
ncbi:thioredoxin domain-containing protein [candidate division WWE3 bacterium]|nr:thioredoxin domain-containing protein [candidate division WWE3 bacterium]